MASRIDNFWHDSTWSSCESGFLDCSRNRNRSWFPDLQCLQAVLNGKSYKRWNFLILVLSVIGVGTPITLFNTVEFLKPAGSTWVIYLLTCNSFYYIESSKRSQLSRRDVPAPRFLTISKILHLVFLATVPIMILVVVLLPTFGYVPVSSSKDQGLVLIEIVFAV